MTRHFQHVLITGGAGYVGTRLVPQLLDLGYEITVYDKLYFGNHLPLDHPRLTVIHGDIRQTERFAEACRNQEAVIHLACISNDASFQLDEALSTAINLDAFEPLVIAAKKAGVRRFIYASTSSVYGVSEAPEIKEDHPLVPITLYNKYKGMCEPRLFRHQSADFVCVTIRPATLCGYSPRMRLDLSVNILTHHAVTKGKITVFGGSQLRPNLNIRDMCDLYERLLAIEDNKIAGETFNVGYQNQSILDLARRVKTTVAGLLPDMKDIEIVTTPSDDIRSYHINSDKIAEKLGFRPQYTIEDAVAELTRAFGDGKLPDAHDNDLYYNIRTMKKIGAH